MIPYVIPDENATIRPAMLRSIIEADGIIDIMSASFASLLSLVEFFSKCWRVSAEIL